MDDSQRLRNRKKEILRRIAQLGDMRRGSVVEQYVEAKKKDGTIIRRGPYPLYSYKEGGKTVSRRLATRLVVESYREEIGEFRKFEVLCGELTAVSQKICDRQKETVDRTVLAEKKQPRRSAKKSRR